MVAVVIVVLARTWRFLRSTQAAETLKPAVCGGTGRSRYRNSIQPPFIVPGDRVKNGDEQLVVLNSIARSIIETVRGQHHDYVFIYRGQRVQRMLNSAWKKARQRANVPLVRVHDLKHTFGRRLGVSFEDRQDFLGHRSRRITTHYSAAELSRLIEAAERVTEQNGRRPELVVLRGIAGTDSRKTPARDSLVLKRSQLSR